MGATRRQVTASATRAELNTKGIAWLQLGLTWNDAVVDFSRLWSCIESFMHHLQRALCGWIIDKAGVKPGHALVVANDLGAYPLGPCRHVAAVASQRSLEMPQRDGKTEQQWRVDTNISTSSLILNASKFFYTAGTRDSYKKCEHGELTESMVGFRH
eukprot:5043785-Amphidinium_carterae.1